MLKDKQICFIGAGAMATAMIRGMVANGVPAAHIAAIGRRDSARTIHLEQCHGVIAERRLALKHLRGADIVILAVKPKDVEQALTEHHHLLPVKGLLISILAGVSLWQLTAAAPSGMAVIRAMPNTSASIGMGATAIAAGPGVNKAHLTCAEAIFAAVGAVERVPEESMDAVTALSGSGPAYIYLFAEALEQGAISLGLKPQMARRLMQQTLLGAAHMLQSSAAEPAELRHQVTSPRGTTQAALDVLQGGKLGDLVEQAMLAAARRSRELSAVQRDSAATD